MTVGAILSELEAMGSPSVRKVLLSHGVSDPCYGVKIGDLKKLLKRVKGDHAVALALYRSGIHDAQYLAGLMADDAQMTPADLQDWVERASGMLAGSTVPWVAAGSPHGLDMARCWIDSPRETVAAAGWATWSGLVALTDDDQLDLSELGQLMVRVQATIHQAANAVRYQMNGFVICVGCYVKPLKDKALRIAEEIGPVEVDVGKTACVVPFAPDYIRKVEARGQIGKKRRTLKC